MKKSLFLLAFILVLICCDKCYDDEIHGCLTCDNSTHCLQCSQALGYSVTPTDAGDCQCAAGYYPKDGEVGCGICGFKFADCQACTIENCTSCPAGRTIDSNGHCIGPCEPKFPGCQTCSDTACTKCYQSRGLILNNENCECFPGGYQPNPTGSFCIPCAIPLFGCGQCTNNQTCTECADTPEIQKNQQSGQCECIKGYYRTTNTSNEPKFEYCEDCNKSLIGCADCAGKNECKQCLNDSYVFEAQLKVCFECGFHITNCLRCSSQSVCTQCQVGYTNANCRTCDLGYYLLLNKCLVCAEALPGCKTCSSRTNCLTCQDTYYLKDGKCQACNQVQAACKHCVNSSYCTSCGLLQNSIMNFDHTCSCGYRKYQNLTEKACSACPAMIGCNECLNSTHCKECNTDAFFLNKQGKCQCGDQWFLREGVCVMCQSLMTQCLRCANGSVCLECNIFAGFELVNGSCSCKAGNYSASNACHQCSNSLPGCLQCSSATQCTSCNTDLNFTLSNGQCSCIPGLYYDLSLASCRACSEQFPQCLTCNKNTCLTCQANYFIQGTGCKPNCSIPLCISCFNLTSCAVCAPFSALSVGSPPVVCICTAGYFAAGDECRNCSVAFSDCLECNSTRCTKCQEGFSVNQQNGQCVFEVFVKIALVFGLLVMSLLF